MVRYLSGKFGSGKSWDALILAIHHARQGAALYVSLDAPDFWLKERLVMLTGHDHVPGLTIISKYRKLNEEAIEEIADWQVRHKSGFVVLDPLPSGQRVPNWVLAMASGRHTDYLIVRTIAKENVNA